MSVKLAPALPADDRNGMPAIASSLVERPDDVHVAVLLVRTKEIRTNARTGDVVPTAEVLACEAFTGVTADAATLHRLLRRQHERRTGKVELPLELEEAIDALRPHDEDTSAADDEPGSGQ
ncbi:hypothetical protein [Amycolatopsis sp. CA-230715]|uniref:hypothetical protein n=1 Tax=Amycolatopsis sp. CA-230715 TaxID=2745196 RepID=UPI001C01F9DD|nr:hypothetical protein [Amycolatopsis sp. CA-230715]QWF78740.1 hypothetical protein HUW46_02138 [Amycolatopsis sp. CA-230715]